MIDISDKQYILNQYINTLDPFKMVQYGDPYIYIKEVKLILDNKQITSGKIKDAFYIGYKSYLDDNDTRNINFFIYDNKLI